MRTLRPRRTNGGPGVAHPGAPGRNACVSAGRPGSIPRPSGQGDIVILNDPYLGGSHLPDITMVAPVFSGRGPHRELIGFVSNRGHHADVGGMTPGSLPLSTELYQEGTIIPPLKLVRSSRVNREVVDLICRNSRTPDERRGDLAAQIASIKVGERRVKEIVERYDSSTVLEHMDALLSYSERLTRAGISEVPDGVYEASDYMDDDGQSNQPVPIRVAIRVAGDILTVDFTGTSPQRPGCINAPFAVTSSAVLYIVHSLVGGGAPPNQGCMRPVTVEAPKGSLVNPDPQHGVAGGTWKPPRGSPTCCWRPWPRLSLREYPQPARAP